MTGISFLPTNPPFRLLNVAFDWGKDLTFGPSCLRPVSEKDGLPAATGRVPEPTPCVSSPRLTPDWEEEEISEAALAEAVADWERSVGYVESGFDYRDDIEEYQHDVFGRECVHAFLLGFARQNQTIPDDLASRIADADRRFVDLTVEGDCIWSPWNYDRRAFWYYFRWPRR